MGMSKAIVPILWRRGKRRAALYEAIALIVEHPLVPATHLDLDEFSDADCKVAFRFDRSGIEALVVHLRLPEVIITETGDRFTSTEALAIVLYRLAYPVRYVSMIRVFGRSKSSLCRLYVTTIDILFDRWGIHLYMPRKLVAARIQAYATSVRDRGVVDGVFGFIDGTKISTCRIWKRNSMQRVIYSGHKRQHCLSFQCVTAPDGLCVHFYGPVEGRAHESSMLRMSLLRERLAEANDIFDGYFIYGDPAYGVGRHFIAPFKGANLSEGLMAFNSAMSSVRESVEWSFGLMKNLWAGIDYKKQNKIMLSPVGKIVHVAMLLTNCYCCINGGNQISSYFALPPPTLAEYLRVNQMNHYVLLLMSASTIAIVFSRSISAMRIRSLRFSSRSRLASSRSRRFSSSSRRRISSSRSLSCNLRPVSSCNDTRTASRRPFFGVGGLFALLVRLPSAFIAFSRASAPAATSASFFFFNLPIWPPQLVCGRSPSLKARQRSWRFSVYASKTPEALADTLSSSSCFSRRVENRFKTFLPSNFGQSKPDTPVIVTASA